MKTRNVIFMLVLAAVIRMLTAAVSPVFETSEARYAAITANMARTGDWTVPAFTYRHRYQPFEGKPPLLYQSGAAVCSVLGVNEFAVRLPVLVSVLAMLALMWRAVGRFFGAERAAMAVAIAITSVAFYAQSGFCMMDGMLSAFVAGAYLFHWLYLRTGRGVHSLGVFACLALGMLTKGPVALVLFGLPVLLDTWFNRRWRALRGYRWLSGTALFLAIAAPWFVIMQRRNPGFLEYFFIHENFLRFLIREYGDRYGAGREFFRGMSVVWLFVVTLPWSLALPAWLRAVPLRDRLRSLRDGRAENAFAFGVLGICAFWCLTSRVPLAYLMPTVPLFALTVATMASDAALARLRRYVGAGVTLAMVALIGSLSVARLTGDRLPGADAAYRRNRYSFEFYHGTPDFAKEARP